MSPAQMFHLPSALKRTKSAVSGNQRRKTDRRETKLHDVLGVSEADINTARNQSVSSAATNKLQSNSLSDATTEAGYSPPQHDKVPRVPQLHLKASSILLHDEFENNSSTASSKRSARLKNYDSSSTLHSHYESHQAPLAVSQQTSDSSRRDFALRKGKPVVVKSITPEKDSLRQVKLFQSSQSRPVTDTKRVNRTRAQTGYSAPTESATPTDGHSLLDPPGTPKTVRSTKSMFNTSKTYKGVRFQQPPPIPSISSDLPASNARTKNLLLQPLDPACVKMNIRRPRVGAKHWFDGHEGDSSEDEAIDEPEFQHNFVLGIETAFQNDQIKANSSDASTITTRPLSSTISTDSGSTPKSRMFPSSRHVQEGPARIATLDAKASKSNLSTSSQSKSQKSRTNPLQHKDLNQSSVLNLSSSDDEDEAPMPQEVESVLSGPILRDSVAFAYSNESQIELGMAKSIQARQTMKILSPPRVHDVKVLDKQRSRDQLRMPIPKRGSSLVLSYLSDPSDRQDGATDLLASFPATPIESQAPSHRTSIRSSSAFSDAESVESRRLMSVTKQEESLLAAMRLKKAAMRYHVTQDKRLETLRNLERGSSRFSERTPIGQLNLPSISQLSLDTQQPFESARTSQKQHRRSLSGDDAARSRASGTTFQTTTSRNASRMSKLTFHTDISDDPQATRLSLSSSNDSEPQSTTPSILSSSITERRQSRDTYFSTSSSGHGGPGGPVGGRARTLTINSHVVALDDLDKIPKRDEIRSQDFIDWPYNGWEARAELGLAQ